MSSQKLGSETWLAIFALMIGGLAAGALLAFYMHTPQTEEKLNPNSELRHRYEYTDAEFRIIWDTTRLVCDFPECVRDGWQSQVAVLNPGGVASGPLQLSSCTTEVGALLHKVRDYDGGYIIRYESPIDYGGDTCPTGTIFKMSKLNFEHSNQVWQFKLHQSVPSQ